MGFGHAPLDILGDVLARAASCACLTEVVEVVHVLLTGVVGVPGRAGGQGHVVQRLPLRGRLLLGRRLRSPPLCQRQTFTITADGLTPSRRPRRDKPDWLLLAVGGASALGASVASCALGGVTRRGRSCLLGEGRDNL